MKTLCCAAALALIPLAAAADEGLTVADAYARGANPRAGAAFMVIENHRDTDCLLSAASSDVAELVELHTHKEVDGVMKMTRIEGGITIPAGGEHALQRGGDHVMLMGLKAPLQDGQVVSLSLDFGDCGTQTLDVTVDNTRMPAHGGQAMQGKPKAGN